MSLRYRSTPLSEVQDLVPIYGDMESVKKSTFYQKLENVKSDICEIIESSDPEASRGTVISVEGTWGSGKSSIVEMLCKEINIYNVAIVYYDSLYYGNVSEATKIFMKSIFDELKESFGLKLGNGDNIANNITPRFELSNGLPKLTLEYKTDRSPTEVVKKNIEYALKQISGKMIVVIDDIDRVPAREALHFLRLVRVLREFPNFIIILPIDRIMLENLLKDQGVASPRRYLEKIIDLQYDINPDQISSKDLFAKILRRKYINYEITDDLINQIWDIYLWELSLGTIKIYENRQRLLLSASPTDPAWIALDPITTSGGDNLVRKFFELTNINYGSDVNYLFRMRSTQNSNLDVFQHYSQLFSNMTFTDLMYGKFFPNQRPGLIFDNTNGAMPINMKWLNDKESIVGLQLPSDMSQKSEYQLNIPISEPERQNYFNQINSSEHYMWDIIRGLAGSYFPSQALQYLAPRTINKIIDNFNIDLGSFSNAQRPEDFSELQRAIRTVVQNVIAFTD